MSDEEVAALLRSDHRRVVIEAAAGCGKTYQGGCYAKDIASSIGEGRVLILTHTHAACSAFAKSTSGVTARVEIKTFDSLIGMVAGSYRIALDLPANLTTWAWQDDGAGFKIMAAKVAALLDYQPMIARALARRYPVVICDEHQDSSYEQHAIIMALHRSGSLVRIFGDPLQNLYGGKTAGEVRAFQVHWEGLKGQSACGKLEKPHRWTTGCPLLGAWIVKARESLINDQPIDFTQDRPASVQVFRATNTAAMRAGYQLASSERAPIDRLVTNSDQLMILASNNGMVGALSAFWNRRYPIWEGHTREALAALVAIIREHRESPDGLAQGLVQFIYDTTIGFAATTHGDRLIREIREGCTKATTGKPAALQEMGRFILNQPSHVGIARALAYLRDCATQKSPGFQDIKIDYRVEWRDAIRIGDFDDPEEGFAEISRRRSHAHPKPPNHCLSSIHKAKGLECDNVLLVAGDRSQFSGTTYAKRKLYVALSRAKRKLAIVVSAANGSPLLKI